MAKIINGNNGYLYCSVRFYKSKYQRTCYSDEDCMDRILCNIITDCEKRGYSAYETDLVIKHYSALIENIPYYEKSNERI
jgi:hypothetical protein